MTERTYSMTAVAPTVSRILGLPAPNAATEAPIAEIAADLAGVSGVAVLAPDALGLTVWRRWQDQLPFLTSLHARRHIVLRSVSPMITPVNFATLISGATPEIHRVGKRTDDIACESLFDVVRRAGGKSLGAGQAGCTGGELLARYADISGRAELRSDEQVTEMVLELSRQHSPRYVIAQLVETDSVMHRVGPSSSEVATVMQATDERLRRLVSELTGLGYGIIILADHGQHDLPPEVVAAKRGVHDGSRPDEDGLVPCTWLR